MCSLWPGAKLRLNVLNLAHVYDANRRTRDRRALSRLLDGSWRKWAARILGQRGLLPRKRHGWRWRSGTRYHWPAECSCGRA